MGSRIGNMKKKVYTKAYLTLLIVIASLFYLCGYIELKDTSRSLFESPNERRYGAVVPLEQRKDPSKIRYATFGTSNTWGAGICDTGKRTCDRKTFAFPWLLSQNARNLAMRAGGPAYAATCTSTMLGTDIFDVVVFEYYMRAHEGLATLARRIRKRFPDAVLIFLMNWNPTQIGRCYNENCLYGKQNMLEWVDDHGFDIKGSHMKHGSLHDPKMHQIFKDANETWWWHFGDPKMRAFVLDSARDVGGYVSHMQAPENLSDWTQYADLFAEDAHHLSRKGHMDVAQRIRDIVEWHGVPKEPRLGNFMGSDHCINWFETGKTDGIEYSPNGMVEGMSNVQVVNRKYALHFVGEKRDGWIRVHNPSDGPLVLYLGYMTTGPPPSLYPTTEVVIEGVDNSGGKRKSIDDEPVVLDVNSAAEFGDRGVHVTRVMKVGIIGPGYSLVRFREVEEAENPFRLVSVLMASEEDESVQLSQIPGGGVKT